MKKSVVLPGKRRRAKANAAIEQVIIVTKCHNAPNFQAVDEEQQEFNIGGMDYVVIIDPLKIGGQKAGRKLVRLRRSTQRVREQPAHGEEFHQRHDDQGDP